LILMRRRVDRHLVRWFSGRCCRTPVVPSPAVLRFQIRSQSR